jgi:3-hydroxyacyl-[acyl-carrier-protein] dehydratase
LSVFGFIDKVAEFKKDDSLTAYYTLTGKEEFLKDHFKNFPVMPGVLLLEMAKQAAGSLLQLSDDSGKSQYRLTSAEEVRFGQFVKPGSRLKISVRLLKREAQTNLFDGRIDLMDPPFGKTLSATLALAPVSGVL